MDLTGAFLDLVVGRVSPRLRGRLEWGLARRSGDRVPGLVEQFVREGDTALDVGASWGLFTHALARAVGPTGSVQAFEPNQVNRRSLDRIARGRPQVHVHHCALSDEEGAATMLMPRLRGGGLHAMGSLSVPDGRRAQYPVSVSVPVRRLDDVLGEAVQRVRFAKLDVEGHEEAVLDGAQLLLAEARPVVLIEIEQRHREVPVARTFERFAEHGYAGYAIGPAGPFPIEDFDVERHQLALLSPNEVQPIPPTGYVNDFLFLPLGAGGAMLSSGLASASPSARQS